MTKLLIITQKVDKNDDILGFFHQWIIEFAKKCEKVVVVCLEFGEYDLPENVKVLSLGKEEKPNCYIAKLLYCWNFYKYIWKERDNYDCVLVHMNPEYVVLGGIPWKLLRKKIYLWYTHKSVNLWLRLAENLADKIFTASEKSFRLTSNKIIVTGHGIDVSKFKTPPRTRTSSVQGKNSKFKIITVGRISKSKNVDKLAEAGEILKKRNFNFELKIAGGPATEEDKVYFEKLKGRANFVGPIPNKDIPEFYKEGDLFVNLSDTGSLDKAVLEAMASGLLVLTSNEAFKEILPSRNFVNNDPMDIAEKIILLSKEDPNPELREYVIKNHNLNNLIDKLLSV